MHPPVHNSCLTRFRTQLKPSSSRKKPKFLHRSPKTCDLFAKCPEGLGVFANERVVDVRNENTVGRYEATLGFVEPPSIGLLMNAGLQRQVVPPRPQASHFMSIVERLQNVAADTTVQLHETVMELCSIVKRRGLVIVFSDCFGDIPQLTSALRQLRARGHDVAPCPTCDP